MTEELLRVEDKKKAVYCSYLNCNLVTVSSVYAAYSKRRLGKKLKYFEEMPQKKKKEVNNDTKKV